MNRRHVYEHQIDELAKLEEEGSTWPYRFQDYSVAVAQLFAREWSTLIHEQAR
ncbi:hypothetical protein AB0H36_46525 [Kribbella sp. NPDC050820]|uniref:hypothetical protein n=1 Tax=Kribbella sp. NPDC050820 TaxID=3155408 RepID=UPI0033E738DF